MAASNCRGARILVVEDNETERAIALAMLVRHGCSVLQARTAEEAFDMLASGTVVDVVFTDVNLPGARSGLQLREEIGHMWPEVPVIVTTGDPRPIDLQRYRSGYTKVLFKPYRRHELIALIVLALQTGREQS